MSRTERARAVAALGTVLLGLLFVFLPHRGAADPSGALPPDGSTTTTTTTPLDPPTSAPGGLPGATSTSSPAPPDGGTTSTTTAGDSTSTTGAGPAGSGSASPGTPGGGASGRAAPDPALEAAAASVPRSGDSSTAPLISALSSLSKLGFSPVQMAVVGFGQFPVAGPASYRDDWLEYRSFPTPHLHQGIDLEAAYGTPLRSPADGVLTYSYSDPDGYGLTAIVTQADKTTYVMAHMSATVLGLTTGAAVHQGQVVGFVGSSGDATGAHLHFEVHPHGGPGIDAKPVLDEFLAAALANVPRILSEYEGSPSPPTSAQPGVTVPAPPPLAEVENVAAPAPVRSASRPVRSHRRPSTSLWPRILGVAALLAAAAAAAAAWYGHRHGQGGSWLFPVRR